MIEAWLLMFVLLFVRVGACVAFLPAPFGRGVPATVKIGLSAAIAYFCILSTSPVSGTVLWKLVSSPPGWIWLAYFTMREVALGYLIAWFSGLVTVPARVAGAYLAQEIGLSLGAMTSPADLDPSNVISNILDAFVVLLILGLNLHHVWIWTIQASLDALPLAGDWLLPSPEIALSRVIQAEQLGLASIGSLIVLMFLVLVLIVVTSKIAPQANLFSFGMPLRSILGCVGLLLFLPEVLFSLSRAAEILQASWGAQT